MNAAIAFMAIHWEFLVGVLFSLATAYGLNWASKFVQVDKDKKIERVLRSAHEFLEAIKVKTPSKLDDALDLGVLFALHLLETKESLVFVSEEEKAKFCAALREKLKNGTENGAPNA